MKLSGHSFDNSVLSSLLDGVCKDVELKTAQTKKTKSPMTGMEIFS